MLKIRIKMTKPRLRCLELSLLVTLLNLLLSLTLWYSTSPSRTPPSVSANSVQDSRLLLSVEYPGESGPPSSPLSTSESAPRTQSFPELIHIDTSLGVYDKSRQFKSHMFTVVGDSWSDLSAKASLCLGAQTSADRLYELDELVARWDGPISISVFTPDLELAVTTQFISYLRRCRPNIAQQVSFHFSYPADHPGVERSELLSEEILASQDCGAPKQVLQTLLDTVRGPHMMMWRESYPYPQNLLRNLAKTGCQSNYTYIPDIDMVPGYPTMFQDLEGFLKRQEQLSSPCTKCAYVIPTYEISNEVARLPGNKTELLSLVQKKKARQFHQAVYTTNQKSSDLKRWEKIPHADKMEVAYKVEKYIFKYEPLYVARADTPEFDERFVGFGMTRNTQVYEMYVAGYSFYLLNNAFTSHRGFQTLKSRPSWRARQQEQNNARFDEFAKEVSAHYSADPYNMLEQLKKMNLKHIKVAYGSKEKSEDTKVENQE